MSSVPTAEEIWKDARWLAQAVDPRAGLIRLVEMSPEDYREASFLDDRMFEQKQRTGHLLPWDDVAGCIPSGARTDARWIFHISHVGSTLVARLLGELNGIVSVREPRALRDLTFFPPEVRAKFIPTLRALLSRTFDPAGAAVIKATSFVSEIAAEIAGDGGRALFLYTAPRSFISGILAGGNSRRDMIDHVDGRAARLATRGIVLPPLRNAADVAAAAWACEKTALELADGPNVLWADFDRFLADIEASLARITEFFGFAAPPGRLKEVATRPLSRPYSKATQYDYSPQLREQLIAEANEQHRADIESALAMLDAAAETAPLLRKALNRAQAES